MVEKQYQIAQKPRSGERKNEKICAIT